MAKRTITVFLCTGKDCHKSWRHVTDGSPGKWLKRQVEAAELPFKLNVVKTECMDRCDQAATVCFVNCSQACVESEIDSVHDADRLLASLRVLADGAAAGMARNSEIVHLD